MDWALKRQIFYILILILFIAGFVFILIYPSLVKAPTCNDLKQNGNETGVDCGGSCVKACLSEAQDLSVLWTRVFKVLPGRYNTVAYFINHNKDLGIKKINYRFRFGDERNVYVGKREGSTVVPPSGNFAVFEPGIDIGNSIPVYVTFEFTETPTWLQVSQQKIDQLKIFVSNIEITNEKVSPRISATIKNNSLFTIPNVNVIIILYDALNNAISASRTYLDQLDPLQNTTINFTWPEPFSGTVAAKEIIPVYDFFSVKLQ